MQTSKLNGNDIFNDVLFFSMIFMVFVFNFNTDKILGISGNTWSNIFIFLFIAWWFANVCKTGLIMWNRIYTYAIMFAFFCFTSYIYSYAKNDSLTKTKTIIVVTLMSISIYQYIVTLKKIEFALKAYSVSGTFMAFYIILKVDSTIGSRFGDVIGDANLVGIILAYATTITLFLFFTKHNYIYILQACCMGYVILLTGSRTAALLLFGAVIVLIYVSAYTYRWKWYTVFMVTIALCAAAYIAWRAIIEIPVLYNALGIRIISFFQIFQKQHSINNEQSTQYRIILAQRALNWFADSPIWGNGINSFPDYNTFIDGRTCFSHCNYTELLSGLGIIGFVPYYGMYIYSLGYVWKSGRKRTLKYTALIWALIIESLIGDLGLVVYYEKCTWILIAIIAGIVNEISKQEREEIFYGQKA